MLSSILPTRIRVWLPSCRHRTQTIEPRALKSSRNDAAGADQIYLCEQPLQKVAVPLPCQTPP
jgi:hypothetical protein